MTRIAIVGGGLAGISAARHALAQGCEIEIFERSESFGGRLSCTRQNSFVIDRGFQIVNVNYPELKKLIKGRTFASRPVFTSLNFLAKDGTASEISPTNIPSLLSTASGSLLQKIRFLIYLFSKIEDSPSLAEESKKFKDLYERVLGPFLSGVFLTDPRNIQGAVVKQILRYFLLGRPHLIDGGVGNLIPALLRGIPSTKMHANSLVTQIQSEGAEGPITLQVNENGKAVTFSDFDYVIVATNGGVGEIPGTTGGNSRAWLASTTVYHCINKLPKRNLKLFVGASFVNSLVISDANPTYAGSNQSLIATTYLGEISEALWHETSSQREAEIAALYKCSVADLQLVSIESIPESLPSFSTNEKPAIASTIIDAENPRIIYAGDSFDEPSQNGALRSGRVAVTHILNSVRAEHE